MASLTENQALLNKKLAEMFQFDQADLDFGIYRIMNYKRDEVKKFLEDELMVQINEQLMELGKHSKAEEMRKIDQQIESAKSMDLDEEMKMNMIKKLEEKKRELVETVDLTSIESDIYSHLAEFFSRYYDEGDFISQRRYKDGVYAIPYEGEEVKLHWANADQYYIKTTEYFNNFTFTTAYGDTVHFRLDEAETEKDNNKGKKRFFQLNEELPFEMIDDELVIHFLYKTGEKTKQDQYNAEAIQAFGREVSKFSKFQSIIAVKDGKTELERQLNRYTARNTYDYFIHKNLERFLSRELDFYIKNEVIFLDDLDEQNDQMTKAYLLKAKIIRTIAKKIITFLAQIEEFQKKLWLKKKFVVETNYCITLDRIPESLYPQTIANTAQIKEWIHLFAIDEIEATEGNLVDEPKVGYSEPLTIEFLKQNPYLVLDTAFFDDDFKEALVDAIDGLDDSLNGLLVHSENFQVLNLLNYKYSRQIKCIYIDPPYNAKSSEILYKNTFKHSSWLSLMENRLSCSTRFLKDDSVVVTAIDEIEQTRLGELLKLIFPEDNQTAITVVHNPSGQQGDNFSFTNEFAYFVYPNKKNVIGKEVRSDEDADTRTFRDNSGNDNLRTDAANCFYPIIVIGTEIVGFGEVSPDEFHPNSRNVILDDGTIAVYPVDNNGIEKKWVFERGTVESIKDELWVKLTSDGKETDIMRTKKIFRYKSTWTEKKYSANSYGSSLLTAMNIPFSYPKSIYNVLDCIDIALSNNKYGIVFDFFAGSGTSGHAVIKLNREDGGNRKYILAEMGEYFDSATKPRIQKAIYSDDWKNGKPLSRKGSSHAFKYIRLESYEDALNNIKIDDEASEFFSSTPVREKYMLQYMLNQETLNSPSLLNLEQLSHPFDYAMDITRNQVTEPTTIDLVETFNYLIGLNVERSYAKQGYEADFIEGEHGVITATLKPGDTYQFKMVEGITTDKLKTLVIWRNLTGDPVKDNAALDEFFRRKKIKSTDFEYHRIYVNGDNNLPNLRSSEEDWKVVLIEEEMKKRMFAEESM